MMYPAYSAARISPYFKKYYLVMPAKKGTSTAIIATARKLAKVISHLFIP